MDIVIIAHFITEFVKDGTSRFVYLAEQLSQSHNVEIVTSRFDHITKKQRTTQEYDLKTKITLLDEPTYKKNVCLQRFVSHKSFGKQVKKYLDLRQKPDVIYSAVPSLDCAYYSAQYAQKHNIPVVATMHTQFKKDFLRAVKSEMLANKLNNNLIELFNKCDECWAVNKAVAEIYRDEYGYKTTPRVMNNATEFVPVKDPAKAKKQIDKKYNIKKDEKVFLFVGRINTVKNILFIVESLRNLKDKNPNFKFKMLFVGSGPDEDKLRLCIDELDMKKEIIMCGKVSDREELAKYFSRADLFLFPSVYDCSSIVQIESASQSTPALFLKGTATASTVTDNVNGYLAEHTPEAYADRILEIMKDEKLYKEVCKNAYKDLYRNWNDTVDEAYEIYKELIAKKNGEVE